MSQTVEGILLAAASAAEADNIGLYLHKTIFGQRPITRTESWREMLTLIESGSMEFLVCSDTILPPPDEIPAGAQSPSQSPVRALQPLCGRIPGVFITSAPYPDTELESLDSAGWETLPKDRLSARALERILTFAAETVQLQQEVEQRRRRVRDEESLLRGITEKSADGILITRSNGEIVFVNPAAEFLIGKSAGQISGKLLESIADGVQITDDSIWVDIPRPNGTASQIEIRIAPILWEQEKAFIAMLRDISERKKIERSMLMEKEQLEITLRSIGDGVITTDCAGNVLLINRVVESITGWTRENAMGRNVSEIFNVDSAEILIRQLECGGKPDQRRSGRNIGITVYHSPLGEKILEYACAPIFNSEGQLIGRVFTLRDVTIRQRMAEHMLQVKKMESLCTAAGKLAHEYDNILTVLMGNITICKKSADIPRPALKSLEKAEETAGRAKLLAASLHALSRNSKTLQKKASIVKLLKEAVAELLTTPLIKCAWEIPDNLWPAQFDQEQMYDVFCNIIQNAVQAMSMGGVLTIRLKNRILSEKIYYPLKSGSYIEIAITDNGKGMDAEILKRVFDPFFTTRPDAMGMGLTTAFSIVRQHEGLIEADSEIGKGSIFTVFLPASVSLLENSATAAVHTDNGESFPLAGES